MFRLHPVFLIICNECGWIRRKKNSQVVSQLMEWEHMTWAVLALHMEWPTRWTFLHIVSIMSLPCSKTFTGSHHLPGRTQRVQIHQPGAYRCVCSYLYWVPWFAWNMCSSLDLLAIVWNPCSFCLHTFVFSPKTSHSSTSNVSLKPVGSSPFLLDFESVLFAFVCLIGALSTIALSCNLWSFHTKL